MRDYIETVGITSVPVESVAVVWPMVRDHLQKAIDRSNGRYNSISVLKAILDQELGLWVVMQGETVSAAYTTRIVRYPTGQTALVVDWLGGEGMDLWLPMVVDSLKAYGADMGCNHVELAGRTGWLRALKNLGWQREAVTARMELANG